MSTVDFDRLKMGEYIDRLYQGEIKRKVSDWLKKDLDWDGSRTDQEMPFREHKSKYDGETTGRDDFSSHDCRFYAAKRFFNYTFGITRTPCTKDEEALTADYSTRGENGNLVEYTPITEFLHNAINQEVSRIYIEKGAETLLTDEISIYHQRGEHSHVTDAPQIGMRRHYKFPRTDGYRDVCVDIKGSEGTIDIGGLFKSNGIFFGNGSTVKDLLFEAYNMTQKQKIESGELQPLETEITDETIEEYQKAGMFQKNGMPLVSIDGSTFSDLKREEIIALADGLEEMLDLIPEYQMQKKLIAETKRADKAEQTVETARGEIQSEIQNVTAAQQTKVAKMQQTIDAQAEEILKLQEIIKSQSQSTPKRSFWQKIKAIFKEENPQLESGDSPVQSTPEKNANSYRASIAVSNPQPAVPTAAKKAPEIKDPDNDIDHD